MTSTKRLLREASELSTHPSPYFHAAPISDTNLHDWHFTIQGPPSPSPYANGLYHGRIVLPPTYPLRPPSFRFLTPSGRFEVNREICLSISGHHEETWQPAWGIRTALIALRSFMDGDAKGQVGGLDVGGEVRRKYAVESRGWKCEGCEFVGGRGLGEVMEEWRGVCKERGVDVEEEEEEEKEKEEGLAEPEMEKKKVLEKGDKDEDEDGKGKGKEKEKEKEKEVKDKPSVLVTEGDGSASTAKTPTSTHTTAHTSISTATATATSAPSPQTITPTPTTSQPQFQHQLQRQQHSIPATPSQETPWLDRAIIGVIIALAVMILRRLAREDME